MTHKDPEETKRSDRRQFLKNSFIAGTGALVTKPLLGSYALAPPNSADRDPGMKANITIDALGIRHAVSPEIYGSFIEHINRCVYGGVYEENSTISDQQGFRKGVLNAAREWGVSVLRWPGGDFASGYHWQDGIGPKKDRPRRNNAAWFEEESNHFGTDEFIAYCRKIGAAPYICVNLGTGTIQEAANWVEYCNGTGDVYFANLRRKYGHPEPYSVRYWGLGNEVYGDWQIGRKNAEDYAKMAHECGKLMKWVDPHIRLVACGFPEIEWNPVILEKLIHIADYISLHDYEGNKDYYEELGSIKHVEHNIRLTAAAIDLTDPLREKPTPLSMSLPEIKTKKRIEIAVDEWNIWHAQRDLIRRDIRRDLPNLVEEKYNLGDALWVASVLNLFQRVGDRVTLANIAQMVNALGTLFTNEKGMFRQTIYFPMKLYRHQCGNLALVSEVKSPTFSSKSCKDVPYLDVSATLSETRKALAIAVVNRHREQAIRTTLQIGNAEVEHQATVFEINGASPEIENSFAEPENVKIVQKGFGKAGEEFEYSFPAHSVTLLRLRTT